MLYLILFAIVILAIVVIEVRAQHRQDIKDRKTLTAMLKNKKARKVTWPSRKSISIK